MCWVGLNGDHKLVHADIAHLTHTLAAIQHVHTIGKRTRKAIGITDRKGADLNARARYAVGKAVAHALAHRRMRHARHTRVDAHDGIKLHHATTQLTWLQTIQTDAGTNHVKVH